MTVDWQRFVELVRGHQRFLLTGHVRPDSDCLGSELGLAEVLQALGKEVLIVNAQATPPNLAFLDPERRIRTLGGDLRAEELDAIDVVAILDTSAWAQLGSMADVVRALPAKRLVLDHHVSQDDLNAESFKDVLAEATGRLVLDAAEQLGVPLTPEMARVLYAAIATDTGWFRFSSTTAGTYRAAAKLVEAGARPQEIFRDLYEQDTLGRVRLRGVILSRFTSELDGRLVHTHVLLEDFARAGALPSDTEDVVNMGLAVADTQMAVILVEQAQGGFKISLRSRCHVDCSQLAEQFGGGGHRAAAGAYLPGPLEAARAKVIDAILAAM
jgi:phosphoesterase RecJ-like protein